MQKSLVLTANHWAAVFLIVVATIVSMGFGLRQLTIQRSENSLKPERLQSDGSRFHIVVVGDSLVGAAFKSDKLTETLLRKNGIDAKSTVFSYPGLESRVFNSVFDDVLDARPDLVLIQSEYFYMNFTPDDPLTDFRRSVRTVSVEFWKRLGAVTSDPVVTRPPKQRSSQELTDKLLKQKYGRLRVELKPRDQMAHFYDFIGDAKKAGIRVKFLEMGRSQEANTFIGELNRSKIRESLRSLEAKTGCDSIRFPGSLGPDHYSDFAHVNEKGRAVFSKWLVEQMKEEVEKNSP